MTKAQRSSCVLMKLRVRLEKATLVVRARATMLPRRRKSLSSASEGISTMVPSSLVARGGATK